MRRLRGLGLGGCLLLLGLASCQAQQQSGTVTSPAAAVTVTVAPSTISQVSTPDSGSINAEPAANSRSDVAIVEDNIDADFEIPPGAPFPNGGIEHLEWTQACVADFGFTLALDLNGGANGFEGTADLPAEQGRREQDAFLLCLDYPVREGWVESSPYESEEGLRTIHQLWMWTHQCMVEHGYPVTDPPSEDAFVEAGPASWHPYRATPIGAVFSAGADSLISDDAALQLEIQQACPADVGQLTNMQRAGEIAGG